MKKTDLVCIIFMMGMISFLSAKELRLARLVVHAGEWQRLDTPVSVSLTGLAANQDHGQLKLYELAGSERIPVPCQLEAGIVPRLWWILSDTTAGGATRRYELVLGDSAHIAPAISCVLDEQKLLLYKGQQPVLQYQHATLMPPEGVDPVYQRSGFIHPLWSPAGTVLSRIQPQDHYHHVGIWNPWTRTRFEDQAIDFWNLGDRQGTVRFAGILSLLEGAVFGGFKVRQEHVQLATGLIPIQEVWDVRVWNVAGGWLWDLSTTLNVPLGPVLLEAYRYGGGLGFRATADWTRENSRILTSEGKTRADADGSKARWCDVSGESAGHRSGILFMSHPFNREHPEPMRVWPEDANAGRGDMFFEFCPIRHTSWLLEPGQDYVLRYRMLTYDGRVEVKDAERLWQGFAHPPQVAILAD